MKMTLLAAASGALLVLSLQGCGGGGGTPSKDDLSEVLADTGGVEADVADCAADELLDSGLSDDQLNAIADDDESDLDADEQAEVVEALTSAITSCMTP